LIALTIGMATYNDFDGVYFTLQSLRLYHDLTDTELLVVDNFGCEHTKRFVEGWAKGRYLLAKDVQGTAAPRDLVFREAQGEAVLCCDSHVLFSPDAIARLKAYYREHPDCRDLLQGPLVYDDLRTMSTHFDPVWREQMWGIWGTDPRGGDPEGEPFEIWGQGLGVFSCRKAAWPGFNPAFRGFGGEEGYIHEKVRQRGGRALCLPWLRWGHRFGRPAGVPYKLTVEDKLWNYVIGHAELGLDPAPVLEHFAQHLPKERVSAIADEALRHGISAPRTLIPTGNASEAVPVSASTNDLPLVSCICPTFGRAPDYQHLLEEAIESFLRQTYPNKELIVLNDCPQQELVCDAPGVRVINARQRYPTLGEKYNAAIAAARGELIAPWEDDDISLPWRLSLSVERLGDADYFNPRRYWFLDEGGLHHDHPMGVGHNLSLYTRAAFEAVGGYPAISGSQDAQMDAALCSKVTSIGPGAPADEELAKDEWYYIYRWGISPAHLSSDTAFEDFYREIGTWPVQKGRFVLRPHWRQDYEAATREAIHAERVHVSPDVGSESGAEGHTMFKAGDSTAVSSNTRVMLFVVGDAAERTRNPAVRRLSLIEPDVGESEASYVARVRHLIDAAIAEGGTHLLVPRENADWLDDHSSLVDYFAQQHELVEASPETGLVFALRPSANIDGHVQIGHDPMSIHVQEFPKESVAPAATEQEPGTSSSLSSSAADKSQKLLEIMQEHHKPTIQLSMGQILAIGAAIRAAAPGANVLVFGCGNDSDLWSTINFDGFTQFVEHDPIWIERIRKRHPHLNIEEISYGDSTVAGTLPIDLVSLSASPVPQYLLSREWDVIVIDGPPGGTGSAPGRSLPIYWSSQIARAETHVFVDDYERTLERTYCDHFFRAKRPWCLEVPRVVQSGKPSRATMLWAMGLSSDAQEAALASRAAGSSAIGTDKPNLGASPVRDPRPKATDATPADSSSPNAQPHLMAGSRERATDRVDENLPLVSCICATYNRPPGHQHLVEEAIESFLRQTYPNKELIVFNDCPRQELVCDVPGVRVINMPERFPGLGQKHNSAIALARGDLIAIWDDDDISLPWRLSLSVERLGDADYFNPKRFWMMARDELRPDPKTNVGHNLSLYRRTAFDAVGGYPPIGSGVDLALDQAFRRQVRCTGSERLSEGALAYGDLYYVYRWGVSPAHLSAVGKDRDEKYARVGERPVQAGRFHLFPHWRKDYVAETRRLIAAMCPASSNNEGATRSDSAELADSTSYPAKAVVGGPGRTTLEKLRESGALTVAEIGTVEGEDVRGDRASPRRERGASPVRFRR
jgi:glycosyltransferase involved in cell wall biosynthesis